MLVIEKFEVTTLGAKTSALKQRLTTLIPHTTYVTLSYNPRRNLNLDCRRLHTLNKCAKMNLNIKVGLSAFFSSEPPFYSLGCQGLCEQLDTRFVQNLWQKF